MTPTRLYKGQTYTLIGSRPHVCRDGRGTTLEVWRSRCADCGVRFETARPSLSDTFAPARRCERHKAPGRRV